jgi:hypothetical protein
MRKVTAFIGTCLIAASMAIGAIACEDEDADDGTDSASPTTISAETPDGATTTEPDATVADTTPTEAADASTTGTP